MAISGENSILSRAMVTVLIKYAIKRLPHNIHSNFSNIPIFYNYSLCCAVDLYPQPSLYLQTKYNNKYKTKFICSISEEIFVPYLKLTSRVSIA